MGEYIDGLDFPICNAFKTQILDGELCYVLDFNHIKSEGTFESKPGRGNGLLLAIDTGISIGPQMLKSTSAMAKGFLRTNLHSSGKKARIHILTSHRHELSKPGIYTLKNLKHMTGTENFLTMPDKDKKCGIEPKEECKSEGYIQEVQKECECIPWSLRLLVLHQVRCLLW